VPSASAPLPCNVNSIYQAFEAPVLIPPAWLYEAALSSYSRIGNTVHYRIGLWHPFYRLYTQLEQVDSFMHRIGGCQQAKALAIRKRQDH
jgi:hypothetical protein